MRLNRPARRRGLVNLTPLIDVVFLLLVFFMLASTFLKFGTVKLEAAGGGTAAVADLSKVALIHVSGDGRFRVDGRTVMRAEMAALLERLVKSGKSEAVVVVRDGARTMDLAAGLSIVRRAAFRVVRVVE
jgi:biopolymer transport protein ExbD